MKTTSTYQRFRERGINAIKSERYTSDPLECVFMAYTVSTAFIREGSLT